MARDLAFEFFVRPNEGFGRFSLQPDYGGSPFSLHVGMKEADEFIGSGMNVEGRLYAVLSLRWDAHAGSVVRWIASMQNYGHQLVRLVGSDLEVIPLVKEMPNIDDWAVYFETPYANPPPVLLPQPRATRRGRSHTTSRRR